MSDWPACPGESVGEPWATQQSPVRFACGPPELVVNETLLITLR